MLCVGKATDCSNPASVGICCSVSISRANCVFLQVGLILDHPLKPTVDNIQTVYTVPAMLILVQNSLSLTASAGTARKVTWVIIALRGS